MRHRYDSLKGSPLHQLCLVVLVLSALLNGQALGQAEQVAKRTCRVVFFQAPNDAPTSLYLFDGKNCQEIDLPRKSFSKVYELPSGALHLSLLAKPIASVEELPANAPHVLVSAGMTDIYLLVTHQPKQEVLPVSLQVVDASESLFKKGQMLWFNLTDHDVGGVVGDGRFVVRARSREVVKEPRRDAGGYPVELYYSIQGDERAHPLTRTQWMHDARARSVVFVFSEPNRKMPRVEGIVDFRVPKKK